MILITQYDSEIIIPHPNSSRKDKAYLKDFKGITHEIKIVQALSRLSVMDPKPLPPKRHNDTKHAEWNMEGSLYKLTSSKEGPNIVYRSD